MIFTRVTCAKTEHRRILHMLREHERSALQHEDALAAVGASEPKMFGKRCTERATADNHEIKRPQIAARRQTGSGASIRINGDERFIKRVAYVATEDVARERSIFSCKWHGDGVQWAVSFAFVE